MRKNVAVILAGGVGERFGLDIPKQFSKVAGKPVIAHTIDTFENHPEIDEIAVVVHPSYVSYMETMVLQNHWTKVKKLLCGGKERYESSLAAIRAYEIENNENVNLIFHDAVRPLISPNIISEVVNALNEYKAVDVAIPAVDTIIKVDSEVREIIEIPDRRLMWQGQTPQGFALETIAKAYRIALGDPAFRTTDDCGVVQKYLPEEPIYVVKGSARNIKLTHIEDLYLLDKLFQLNSIQISELNGFENLADKTLVVFGGNSGIGKAICNIASEYGANVYSFSRSENCTDIRKPEDIKRAFSKVAMKSGQIDYIINSSAVLRKEPFAHMKLDDILEIIETNYNGMVYISQYAYPYLRDSKGCLLHFTSSSYTLGRPYYSLYSSTKAAVVNFVQALSQEWQGDGIRVNCINPERTKTPMRERNFGREDECTLLKPEDVAKVAIATLLSNQNGRVIEVRIKNNKELKIGNEKVQDQD